MKKAILVLTILIIGLFLFGCTENISMCPNDICEIGENCPADCGITQNDSNGLNIALIMMNYQNLERTPPTLESLNQLGNNIKNFWNEDSYSKINISKVDIYGWYTYPSSCQTMIVPSNEELIILTNNEIKLDDYNRIGLIYFNDCSGGGNGSGERFVAGFNEKTLEKKFNNLNWNNLDQTINHELGHTFGFGHSLLLRCGNNTSHGNCTIDTYGNNYDLMGGGGILNAINDHTNYETMIHTNALHKNKIGWLKDSKILDITSDGTYKIGPLHNHNAPHAARFYIDDAEYYLEWRTSKGFDSGNLDPNTSNVTNGLLINRTINIKPTPESMLLNFNKEGDNLVKALELGETFEEDSTGFILTVDKIYKSEIEFSINFVEPTCIPTNLLQTNYYNQTKNEEMALIDYRIYFTSIESNQCNDMNLTTSINDNLDFSSNLTYCEPVNGSLDCYDMENQIIIPNKTYQLTGTINIPLNGDYFGKTIYLNLSHNNNITKIPIYIYEQ
jgi:hypothetical protein